MFTDAKHFSFTLHPIKVLSLYLYLKFYLNSITPVTNLINYLLPIALQYITATNVLKNVATIAGAITAAGFALPYWLR